MTLTEFLLARIAEDECVALSAPLDEGWYEDCGEVWVLHDKDGASASGLTGFEPVWADGAAKHIARWDPARVLAECEAKRRIVEHAQNATNGHVKLTALQHCTWLVQVYVDHPDFQQEWAVT